MCVNQQKLDLSQIVMRALLYWGSIVTKGNTLATSDLSLRKWLSPILHWQLWLLPSIVLSALLLIAQYDFLIFHTLAELFTIIISFIMFSLAWATYDYSKNLVLLFLACGYLWIGSLDLMHMLTYKGMNIFSQDLGNIGVQYWLGARYSEALLLLTAPILAPKAYNKFYLVTIFGLVALSINMMIYWDIFPTGFIDGVGLTPFKIYSEYTIDAILFLAVFSVFRYGHTITHEEKVLISTSIILTMCAELAFTFYVDVYGFSNLIGHTFKLYSFWIIFRAIILSNLRAPYAALHKSKRMLRIALDDANNANRAKSEFLANMSHDLRTPLNAIMGFSDMMRTKVFGPLGNKHYEEYANDIYDSGAHLVSLINDILDLSRIEAGKYSLVESQVNIEALIHQSFRQLSTMADDAGHVLTAKINNDMPDMLGDERVMIQIFNNLLSNAIKFTPDSGEIVVAAHTNGDNSITISVIDRGIGISDKEILKALNPFEQVSTLHSRRHEGTGLGLHLCNNFMELFGGGLKIQSEPGNGTTVTLCFPPERTVTT